MKNTRFTLEREKGRKGVLLLLLLCSLSPLLPFTALADSSRISALLTITNAPTTAGQTLVINSSTRTWTNNPALNPSAFVRTNSTIGGSMTNLFLHVAQYPFSPTIGETKSGTNAIKFTAALDQALSVSASGSWASVTYSTQLVTTPFTVPVRVPLDVEASTNAIAIAELLVKGLNDYSTSRAWTNWTSLDPILISPTFTGALDLAGSQKVMVRSITASATVSTNDYFLSVAPTNAVALTLPAATNTANQVWIIQDQRGYAATNNITLTPASGDRINGAANYVISANYGAAAIISRGGTNFYICATAGIASGGGGGSGLAGNMLLVDSVNGDDATGARGGLPFLTLGVAKTAAASGDTIFVGPGSYSATNILKDGVNWHFYSGSIVTNTSSSAALFDDQVGAVTSVISGDGVFYDSGSYLVAYLTNASSVVDLKARKIVGGNPQIEVDAGTFRLESGSVENTGLGQVFWIGGSGAAVTINRTRLVSSWASSGARCVTFSASNTNLVLQDCVLVSDPAATYSIDGSASSLRIYGGLMATATNSTAITLLTGATRFEVDANVQ